MTLSATQQAEVPDALPLSSRGREPVGYLTFDRGGEEVTVAVEKSLLRIGRAPDAHVRLNRAMVSPRHAVVLIRHGEAVLMDEGSLDGVWMGQRRIRARVLNDGDAFSIGLATIRFSKRPPATVTPLDRSARGSSSGPSRGARTTPATRRAPSARPSARDRPVT